MSKELISNSKDNRIEIIRIISILLVVLLHVTNRYLIKMTNLHNIASIILICVNCITRVAVPLFFAISGIVNIPKKYDKKKYWSRIIRMTIILIIWTLVYYFIGRYKQIDLYHAFFAYLKPHLWYMYAIIGLCISTPFISKMVQNLDEKEESLFIKLWLGFSGVYYLFKVIMGLLGVNTTVTHAIPLFNATYYLGYYIVGYLIYKNYKKYSKYDSSELSVVVMASFVINVMLTILVSFDQNKYFQGFFGYSNILIIIPSMLLLIIFLRHIKDKEYKIIKFICPYILGVYLSHILILDLLIKYLKISNPFIGCFVYVIFTFIISYGLAFLIKKIPYINKYIC